MRIVTELDHKIRREIRDARAIDPLVSVVDLQEHLEEKFNRTFSRKYIAMPRKPHGMETLDLERFVDDPEIHGAAAKTLKGFCLTYLPHYFPLNLPDYFDELTTALQNYA